MSAPQNPRVGFVSTARVIGILLVVLGHSYPFGVQIPVFWDQLRSFIYTFHMPLFILISGYLAGAKPQSAGSYVKKRAKRLLVPYFTLSLIAFVPKVLVQGLLNDTAQMSLWYLVRSELVPRDNVWGHFWYIPVIFFFGVFSAFTGKYLGKSKTAMLAALVGSFALLFLPPVTNWFALEDMRQNLFYYVLGMALACSGAAESIASSKLWLLGLPLSIGLVMFAPGWLRWAGAVLMIGFILCVGTLTDFGKMPLLALIERYSYTIFLLSWPAQAVMEVLLNQLLALPVAVTMVCMFTAGILVPLLCVAVISALLKRFPTRWLEVMVGM